MLGLNDAIDAAAQPLRRDGVEIDVTVDVPDMSAETESLLYRTANELLRNVHEHAHATAVSVSVDTELTTIRMVVTDNGAGFSASQHADRARSGHLGIELQRALLKRAGGTLQVTSIPGSGTTATVEMPR